jgi:hypothetical protein
MTEVRRHNGQCEYGQWIACDRGDCPPEVRQAVAEQETEERQESGRVNCGGQMWSWRQFKEEGVE